jgi:hypothetical protein
VVTFILLIIMTIVCPVQLGWAVSGSE